MSIPTEFNGNITFFWSTKYNFMAASHHAEMGEDWIQVSDPVPVNCAFYDVRAKQIEALEKQIEQERAESQFRINQMLGKIQELQAIEAK